MPLKPICHPCRQFFRPAKTGFYFIEGMPVGNNVRPGLVDAGSWRPYKLWAGDLWECRGCKATIIIGTTGGPIAEHFMTDFKEQCERLHAVYQVNDC
jgi:hypothetical protein